MGIWRRLCVLGVLSSFALSACGSEAEETVQCGPVEKNLRCKKSELCVSMLGFAATEYSCKANPCGSKPVTCECATATCAPFQCAGYTDGALACYCVNC